MRQLRANLGRVVGSSPGAALDALTREAMRSYLRYWSEVFRLPVLSRERIVRDMVVENEARLRAALATGRGAIAALPHMGNWDLAGAWAVANGLPITTVAERVRPESLFDRFVAFRTSLGMEVLPLSGGARPVFDVLADRLRSGRLVCLLADRDLTARGIEVSFFGEATRMPRGPAALALETGATLFPATLWFVPNGWRARVGPGLLPPPIEDRKRAIAILTQALADHFAAGIAGHPADWHMLQPFWLADLTPARRARLEQGAG